MSLLAQTVSITINVLIQNEAEITLIDLEEDTDSEENEDQKIKPIVGYISNFYFKYPSKISYHIANQKLLDVHQKILIPPPDLS